MGEYFERLAVYIIFAVIAGISIIFWVFNWICWKRQCCCFIYFDEYCNKVFTWWLSWVFLCGVLACCISGIVTANRFGFSLYGAQCGYERIYYDIVFGQQKKSYPKWTGRNKTSLLINALKNIKENLQVKSYSSIFGQFYNDSSEVYNSSLRDYFLFPIPVAIYEEINSTANMNVDTLKSINNFISPFLNYYFNLYKSSDGLVKKINLGDQITILENFDGYVTKFYNSKSEFMDDFDYYVDVAFAMGKIVPLIYFCILLSFVVASGALLIVYYCKKRNQLWWILPMHIAWNGIRFFMFSFFIYGSAFGMLFLFGKDTIAYYKYAFTEQNIYDENIIILPAESKSFFQNCLFKNSAYESLKENNFLNEFIKNADQMKTWIKNNQNSGENIYQTIQGLYNNINSNFLKYFEDELEFFQDIIDRGENIYDSLNCTFINNNINLMYRALWDFAWETRILCALSCCIGFFGAIAVYGFLWAMNLWKRDDNYVPINKPLKSNNYSPVKKPRRPIKPPSKLGGYQQNTELSNNVSGRQQSNLSNPDSNYN